MTSSLRNDPPSGFNPTEITVLARLWGSPIIDIIIILKRFGEIPFIRRMPMMMKLVPFPKHLDYLCYTPEEFGRMKDASSIIIDALNEPLELAVS